MCLIPKKVFFVKGKGFHKSKLGSFEQALREAGIERFNLIEVSSILPPNCIEISQEDGLNQLRPGQIIYIVLSKISSNEHDRLICASIGVAKPADKELYGYLSEHHCFNLKPNKIGEFAENLAAEMLVTTLSIPFNPDANYDEKKEVFRINGKIIETKNITESTIVKEEGEWATVIAAAVFIL
ncbi:MAG: pyruvoyl-dependent arginine decarboxylase [Promethearchaeota archaeon]